MIFLTIRYVSWTC